MEPKIKIVENPCPGKPWAYCQKCKKAISLTGEDKEKHQYHPKTIFPKEQTWEDVEA
jgi:hypothetical protein